MQVLKREPSYYQSKGFLWRQRIGLGCFDYGCNLAYLLSNTYLLFYYTNCAGIDAKAAGFMFVVTKFIDAVTDYMVGTFVDHTDTKMGRYRPWILAGAPILAIGMGLLFSVPIGWGSGAKLAWAYITYSIFSFGYTLVNIPLSPLITAMTSVTTERTNLATSRMLIGQLGSLTSSLFVVPLVYFFAGSSDATGSALAAGYRNTNIVLGIVVVIIICVCVFNVTEINPPTPAPAKQKASLLQDVGNVFKNKYYIMLLVCMFSIYVGLFGMYGAIQYYYTYVVNDLSSMTIALSLLSILSLPPMILAAYLNGRGIDKIKLLQFGSIIDAVGYGILFFTTNAVVATASVGLIGFGFGFRSGMLNAMFTDSFDYTDLKCGKSLAGTQAAVSGFMSKVASASASALISALLVWGAYDSDALDAVLSAGQSIAEMYPQTRLAINMAFGGLSLIATILSIVIMFPYDLDKKYPEIRAALDKRRAEQSEAAAE